MRHLTTLFDLSPAEVEEVLATAADLKAGFLRGERPPLLQGRVLTLLFEKPSLRTRNSFEAAMAHLGGTTIFLSTADAGLQGREALSDVARVLSGYSDAIAMRTFSQKLIEKFSVYSRCPVINSLSDDRHPCQALTDLLTMQEVFGDLKGRTIAFIGDGNNVAVSLASICAMLDVNFVIASPEGYVLPDETVDDLTERHPQASISRVTDPFDAVASADVVYTDVWASMGQEGEAEARQTAFAGYQVNEELLSAAPKDARFMHDLPAKRGLEVTDDVMDGPQSIVFQQAENRMHLAKGLLVWLLKGSTVGAS